MQETLFSEFPAVSPEAWRQRIEKDLKGKPYEELLHESEAGITIQPFYTAAPEGDNSTVGEFPFRRGNIFTAGDDGWQLLQIIGEENAEAQINEAVAADAQGFIFDVSGGKIPAWNSVDLCYHTLHLIGDEATDAPALLAALKKLLADKGVSADVLTGALYLPQAYISADAQANFPNFVVSGISVYGLHEAAASEQISAILRQVKVTELRKTAIHFAIGTQFFNEIAKFRAFRVAYAKLMQSLGEADAIAQSPFVIAQTAPYPASKHDALNNLLKASTEVMSAVLGGCNGVAVLPYDGSESARAARLGRNVQHLLRHESHLASVKDAVGGAYFIETLTEQIAEKAAI